MRLYDEKKLRELIKAHGETTASFAVGMYLVAERGDAKSDAETLHSGLYLPARRTWETLDAYLKTGEQQNTEVPR